MSYDYQSLREKLQTKEGKRFYKRVKKAYDKFTRGGKPVMNLSYSDYKLIYKTGNRTKYDKQFHDRSLRLPYLEVLALGNDEYLEDLEEIIASICDEYTWLIAAHAYAGNEGREEEFDYTRVDLFSSVQAMNFADAYHIFGDKLCKDIRFRIKDCVKSKVLDFFENRTFWWEREDMGCNWTPVCACGVGIAYMYLFPERFALQKNRIFALFTKFLKNSFMDDGACTEGASYYGTGVGYLLYFCDKYKDLYGEFPAFLNVERMQKIFAYHKNSIVDDWIFPFGDANPRKIDGYGILELQSKKLFPDYELPDFNFLAKVDLSKSGFYIAMLDCIGEFSLKAKKTSFKQPFSHLFETAQIFSCKKGDYVLFAKGGNNNEMHNHNDVGAFAFYVGDERIIADIGPGEYTWAYGEDMNARYGEEIFCCGSCGHSVPIVGNIYQTYGENTSAQLISHSQNGMKIDIANAYKLKDTSLTVEFECKDNGISVLYGYKGESRAITFRFTSDFEPKQENGNVWLSNVKLCCDTPYTLSYKQRKWKIPNEYASVWVIDFIVDKSDERQVKFDFLTGEN